MDRSDLRLMYRLSMAATVALLSVTAIVSGLELRFGRAGRGLPILTLVSSLLVIALLARSLRAARFGGRAPVARDWLALALERAAQARDHLAAVRHRRRRRPRVREAELAAAAAARDDERLAPGHIVKAAEAVYRLVYLAWNARDVARLATLLEPELLAEWERDLHDDEAVGEHRRTEIAGDVRVELVGLQTGPHGTSTAVLFIEAEVHAGVESAYGGRARPAPGAHRSARRCEYWTLVRRLGSPWTVAAVEPRDVGDRHLSEPLALPAALRA